MNPIEDPRILIIALKGLPISVVALLRNYPQPVAQAHLCDMLNSTDKTLSRELHLLEAFQILTHSTEGWSITARITQLGFSLPEWFQAAVESDLPVEKPVEKGRKFSDSNPLTTSSTSTSSSSLTNLKLEKNQLLELDLEPESELDPESEPEPEPELRSVNSKEFRECHQAARESGIEEPKATKLARLPHVSVEMIEYHVETVLKDRQKIGLAIYRIEKNHSVKKLPEPKRSADFYERQKYVTGKYAEFINH